eukprot:364964-Chlamydomonas_euryale.AAC.18
MLLLLPLLLLLLLGMLPLLLQRLQRCRGWHWLPFAGPRQHLRSRRQEAGLVAAAGARRLPQPCVMSRCRRCPHGTVHRRAAMRSLRTCRVRPPSGAARRSSSSSTPKTVAAQHGAPGAAGHRDVHTAMVAACVDSGCQSCRCRAATATCGGAATSHTAAAARRAATAALAAQRRQNRIMQGAACLGVQAWQHRWQRPQRYAVRAKVSSRVEVGDGLVAAAQRKHRVVVPGSDTFAAPRAAHLSGMPVAPRPQSASRREKNAYLMEIRRVTPDFSCGRKMSETVCRTDAKRGRGVVHAGS